MITISYTITPIISDHLASIDQVRTTILTTPIALKTERRLRFDAREHYQPDVRVFDWIRDVWTANPKPITPKTIHALAGVLFPPREAHHIVKDMDHTLRYLSAYLASQRDHPILLSSVALAQTASQPRIGRLLFALVLAKYGYDCRAMLAPASIWEQKERWEKAWDSIEKYGQMTLWHEYITDTIHASLHTLMETVAHASTLLLPESETRAISRRQEHILALLDHPAEKITNRDITRRFRVSQITASRDLSRLASFGLLFAHGKGRSVYYTKL